jgi:AcrR family transcriptional regulator
LNAPSAFATPKTDHRSAQIWIVDPFSKGTVVAGRTKHRTDDVAAPSATPSDAERPLRADARRSQDALLHAAKAVFAASGVDAPIREIADSAGVGLGTLYRHFPRRSDLIAAVFRREIDACADIAATLAEAHAPFEALANWMQRYAAFVATKRGLAQALHSGDPAFDSLPGYFDRRLRPALRTLLDNATAAGVVRTDIDADELLSAVASLGMSARNAGPGQAERMVALLVDGMRCGAGDIR